MYENNKLTPRPLSSKKKRINTVSIIQVELVSALSLVNTLNRYKYINHNDYCRVQNLYGK